MTKVTILPLPCVKPPYIGQRGTVVDSAGDNRRVLLDERAGEPQRAVWFPWECLEVVE